METQKTSGKRVVIVGGGAAGSILAKTLQFTADVTLIDPKEYYEIPWASLRAMVEPSFGERLTIYHKDYLTNGRIVISSAINITETEVLTADGQQIAYDYLVIATGHTYSVPESRTARLNEFQTDFEKIKSARSILIVGGGPTGVELAGEIAVDFPEKKVTLVHSGPRLIEFIGPKASNKALKWLKKKGVEVKLEQRVDLDAIEDGSRIYRTTAAETIEADCHFICLGKPLGSSWLKETFLKNSLDSQGRLKVDKYMTVQGHPNIFALGDITDIPELKQGHWAQAHAAVAAKNLKIKMAGGKESKLATYKPGGTMAIVSLGRKGAVGELPFMTISGTIPAMIKSKDLFVGKGRQELGLKA